MQKQLKIDSEAKKSARSTKKDVNDRKDKQLANEYLSGL